MANKQQQIIDAVITRLGSIKKANGYETDIGNDVREWDTAHDNEDELPIVDVRDDDTVAVDDSGAMFVFEMPLSIEIKTAGSTSKSDARKMIFDVYKAVKQDPDFGNLADNTFPQTHAIEVEQENKQVSRVLIKILIKFSAPAWGA